MTDVLRDRPLAFDLKLCARVIHTDKQCVESRQRAAKSFDEVRQHPWRVNEGELPLRPCRTVDRCWDLNRTLSGIHDDCLADARVQLQGAFSVEARDLDLGIPDAGTQADAVAPDCCQTWLDGGLATAGRALALGVLVRRRPLALDDLPVRVLPHDLASAELPVVAPTDPQPPSFGGRAGEQPFRDTEVSLHPVTILAVMDVREPREARRQGVPDGRSPGEPCAPRVWSPRHVERAVVGEERHDRVEIVGVEGVEDRLQSSHGQRLRVGHG